VFESPRARYAKPLRVRLSHRCLDQGFRVPVRLIDGRLRASGGG